MNKMKRRISIVLIIAIVAVGSGCTSEQKEKSPTEVTTEYFNSHFGLTQNTKSAYKLLSNETRENQTYADYEVEMENTKKYETGTFEIRSIDLVSKNNETANVSVSLKTSTALGNYNQQGYLTLVKENGGWKIKGAVNPFSP